MTRARTRARATVLPALAVLLAGASACGAAAEKASEEAAERAIERESGGEVELDLDGGGMSIETEDGTFTADGQGNVDIRTDDGSMTSNMGEVPEGWPEDVPLPDDIEVLMGSTNDVGDGATVSIVATTAASPDELFDELKAALGDWEISGETTATVDGATTVAAEWSVDGRRVSFTASESPDGETSLTIGHTTLR